MENGKSSGGRGAEYFRGKNRRMDLDPWHHGMKKISQGQGMGKPRHVDKFIEILLKRNDLTAPRTKGPRTKRQRKGQPKTARERERQQDDPHKSLIKWKMSAKQKVKCRGKLSPCGKRRFNCSKLQINCMILCTARKY